MARQRVNQSDLARKIGRAKQTVSRWLDGGGLDIETLSTVSAALGVAASEVTRRAEVARDQDLLANGCFLTTRRADDVMMMTDHVADVHDLTVERERRRADRRRVIAPYQPWRPGRSPKRVTHSEPTASRAANTHGVRYATTGGRTAVAASA